MILASASSWRINTAGMPSAAWRTFSKARCTRRSWLGSAVMSLMNPAPSLCTPAGCQRIAILHSVSPSQLCRPGFPAPPETLPQAHQGISGPAPGERGAAMAYGHAERVVATIRQLEAETKELLNSLDHLDPEQARWLEDVSQPSTARERPVATKAGCGISVMLSDADRDRSLDLPGRRLRGSGWARGHAQDTAAAEGERRRGASSCRRRVIRRTWQGAARSHDGAVLARRRAHH